jgi:holo-ACP synthase CitX
LNAEKDAIARILSGREERAQAQKFLLGVRGVSYVLQISLNIPGTPKEMPGDGYALSRALAMFLDAVLDRPFSAIFMSNHAGKAEIMSFGGDAGLAKIAAMEIEEAREWGRVIDADVITRGGHISRSSLGKNQRKCLLCGEPAGICARSRAHGVTDLRAEALRLLGLASFQARHR